MGVTAFAGFYNQAGIFLDAMSGVNPPKLVLLGIITGESHQDIFDNYLDYGDLVAGGHEIAAVGGYTTGGVAFAAPGAPFTYPAYPPHKAVVTLAALLITAVVATVKYAALIDTNNFDQILAFYDMEDTGGSIVLTGEDLVVDFPSNEVFEMVTA